MVTKRKRDDLNDSDSDEIRPGKQILPVANLPYDFDREPQDGMQYLFLVRRDARRLPDVTRARNPYEVPHTKVVPAITPPSTNGLPCQEWRIAFQTHFSYLRKNLTQVTIIAEQDQLRSARKAIPEKKDRDAWWKFLAGYPGPAWCSRKRSTRKKNPSVLYHTRAFADSVEIAYARDAMPHPDVHPGSDPSHFQIACLYAQPRSVSWQPSSSDTIGVADTANSEPLVAYALISSEEDAEEHVEPLSPPEVAQSYLWEIDHRMSIHLLMYFTHWINVHLQNSSDPLTAISVNHGQWIFSLLTKVEDRLSADEMNLLRNLARACLGLIQRCRGKRAKNTAVSEGVSSSMVTENTTNMSDASCWMIFTAVAGYWGQKDLWADAETTLASA